MNFKRIEAYEASLKYFKGDTLAADVWVNKYALKDTINGETVYYELSPDDMHHRIARELHRIEIKYENPLSEDFIYELIKNFEYIIPQGSPMSGIGNDRQVVSLSNCFVVGYSSDSYGSIMKVDEEQIQLMKRRGGVGHDLSHIRPAGTPVKNSALTSTGLVPFMERYSNSTKEVAQDGRRGALMLSCSIKHPDSEDFIDAKLEKGKVTGANVSIKITDDFMTAVINANMFTQIFPIDSINPTVIKEIDAQKLWKKIIHNAWKSAEPGVLFWDTILRESVPDCYQDSGFKTVGTNPCIVGETLIAVADGRNAVSIKQLADEGKDVPVYCSDNNGQLAIRTMRNPRITGYEQSIYKVNIEGGHSFRVTGNHKFILRDNTEIEAKNLKNGDSLKIMTKSRAAFHDIIKNSNSKSQDYYWLTTSGRKGLVPEHRIISNCNELNKVVHHKDYNGLNNHPDNLEIMTKKEHDYLHSKDMIGDKNPYHRMSVEWKQNFASHIGPDNHKFNREISNTDIKNHALILTKELNRRFSKDDWAIYTNENYLPQFFSDFRHKELGSVVSLSKLCAIELNIDFVETDPRLVKTYKKALENGYNAEIVDNEVLVTKICEECGEEFKINYFRREIAFCSNICSINHLNKNQDISKSRINSINDTYLKKGENNRENQLKIYSGLKFELNRDPLLKEWENECKLNNITHRLNTKHGFKNYKEIKEESDFFNHKVVSVELDGIETVYNGTVDDFHNFYSGCFEEINKFGKVKYISALTRQCGEIPLCPYDSCRLLAINLYGFVVNPFTKDAYFDWKKFEEYVIYAERFMDDIIDLEIEKIEKILEKIEIDPEPEDIKRVERETWLKIMDMTMKGRRTGLGITAEGDMLAALNLRYGTPDATDFSTQIHKVLAISAYRSSVIMAKERGAFPIYDYNRELTNPFVQRLKDADPELDTMLKEWGRRNIALLTIAPTGSVSIMTQTTSGIEPAYLVSYKRRRKINTNDKGRVDFVDAEGIKWEEYNVFHHKFETWLEVNGYNVEDVKAMKDSELKLIIEKSPYHKATSNDVDWVEKVRMQGMIQKYVDHSISVTVNLPNNVTEETVSKVYETGWKSGCFPQGHSIYTSDGIKDISEISVGDVVINDDGVEDVVDDVYNLPIQKRRFVSIKASGIEEITCTVDHPILVLEMNNNDIKKSFFQRNKNLVWKKAGDIIISDHILTPKSINISNKLNKLNFSDYIKSTNIIEDESIFLSRELPWKKDRFVKSAKSNHIKNSITIGNEFCNFLGWFIAEGHFASESCIRLNFNLSEKMECERLKDFIESEFNLKTSTYITTGNGGQSLRLEFHSKILSEFLENIVGRKSINKHLPIFYTNLSKNNLSILLESYYKGDGGTTVSKRLARELFMANLMIDDKPYFKPDYTSTFFVGKSKSNISAFKTAKPYNNFLCYRVNRVNTFESDEKVYNFSVSNNDTYIVNGVIAHNCKGMTVYRDGSRQGVIMSTEGTTQNVVKETQENNAKPRSKRLECDVVRFTNNKEKWVGFLGLMTDDKGQKYPYELFTGLIEEFYIPPSVEKGEIVKFKEDGEKSRYDFVYKDKDGYNVTMEGLNRAFDREFWNTSKLLSAFLRHRIHLPSVINLIDSLQLDSDVAAFGTWKSGVKRIIKRHINSTAAGESCPECGSNELKYEAGCKTCPDCGWGKCSD